MIAAVARVLPNERRLVNLFSYPSFTRCNCRSAVGAFFRRVADEHVCCLCQMRCPCHREVSEPRVKNLSLVCMDLCNSRHGPAPPPGVHVVLKERVRARILSTTEAVRRQSLPESPEPHTSRSGTCCTLLSLLSILRVTSDTRCMP